MNNKILHIGSCDKFIPPFIEFVRQHFDHNTHEYHLLGGMAKNQIIPDKNVHLYPRSLFARINYYFQVILKMHSDKKVILHGLFDWYLVVILFFMPWLLKKCYWVMWGGDLYVYQLSKKNWRWKLKEFFRRPVIKNIGYLVTYIKGDFELAQQWYGSKGKYLECFMYTSNIYKEYEIPDKKHLGINIMVGNSADITNNHFEVFEKLDNHKSQDINIYVPLTYGNKSYTDEVIIEGKNRYGKRFHPITEHMPFEKYLEFLGTIDIAIFNHKRQQAMGNTITLLGLGKKVFVRSDVTQWDFFKSHGVEIYDIEHLNFLCDDDGKLDVNKNIIKNYFSEITYVNQLSEMFN